MAITAMMMMVAAGIGASPADLPYDAVRPVPVCIAPGFIPGGALAKQIATEMFLTARVKLEWHTGLDHRTCPADAIQIRVGQVTNPKLLPGSLAYAMPYEGTHIRVFNGRIEDMVQGPRRPRLLAHVLVHEITHMLQGVCRHSETGVMKAKWGPRDHNELAVKPLAFAKVDIQLIHLGLAARARTVVAVSSAPDAVAAQ